MSRREQILQLADAIAVAASQMAVGKNRTDSGDLLACNAMNGAAADLVRLTREEACSIVDANMDRPMPQYTGPNLA